MKNVISQKPSEYAIDNKSKYDFVRTEDIKNKKILDIGCGYGWFEFLALNDKATKIIGTEISEKDLKTAKANLNDKKLKFEVASALELPFADGEFDTVVSWEVLEHIPVATESIMFSEVDRVLKNGGVFYLSTPNGHIVSRLLDPAWLLTFGKHRHYTDVKIRTYAKGTNLKVDKINVKGGKYYFTYALNMYFSKWVLRRAPIFEQHLGKKLKRELDEPGNKVANLYARFVKQI